jgi:hypothetical protein
MWMYDRLALGRWIKRSRQTELPHRHMDALGDIGDGAAYYGSRVKIALGVPVVFIGVGHFRAFTQAFRAFVTTEMPPSIAAAGVQKMADSVWPDFAPS